MSIDFMSEDSFFHSHCPRPLTLIFKFQFRKGLAKSVHITANPCPGPITNAIKSREENFHLSCLASEYTYGHISEPNASCGC